LEVLSVTAEEVGFAAACQIGKLRTRVRGCGRKSQETRYLISSADGDRLNAEGLLNTKRGYWAIEAVLHYRLDDALEEDRSRVRSPKAARILGMCRRLAVSFANAWLREAKKTNVRLSTRDFQDHLKRHQIAAGFALITAKEPSAWRQVND
jgi:predicted transposase YbfD/YdcC